MLKPGDLICGQCGTGNNPQRSFCRKCGASLVDAQVAPHATAGAKVPWWKRLFARRPTKVLHAGERRERGRARIKARRAMQGLLAVVAVGGALGLVGPWRSDAREFLRDLRQKVMPKLKETAPISAPAILVPPGGGTGLGTATLADNKPENMTDDFDNTYWAEGRKNSGEGLAITFTFEKAVHLAEIRIASGTPGEAFQSQPQLQDILLSFLGEGGEEVAPSKPVGLEKKSKAELQSVKMNVEGVKVLKLEIKTVFPGVGSGAGTVTAIPDIRFFHKT